MFKEKVKICVNVFIGFIFISFLFWNIKNIKPKETIIGSYRKICQPEYVCNDTGIVTNYSTTAKPYDEIQKQHKDVTIGGSWTPSNCISVSKTAIIIPQRDREKHMQILMRNIIPFMKAQQKAFTIFVVTQIGPQLFNKGQLMNAGFIESLKLDNYTCFVFHDVDMIPINLCNIYYCPKDGMRHLGLSRDLKKPEYIFEESLSGASSFTKEMFVKINGFTNILFGWGGSDVDGIMRCRQQQMKIHRYSLTIGNYYHVHDGAKEVDKSNPRGLRGIPTYRRMTQFMVYDGLNSVNYKVVSIKKELLLTRITVEMPGPTSQRQIEPLFEKRMKEMEVTASNKKTRV